jgi:hypothetical protein
LNSFKSFAQAEGFKPPTTVQTVASATGFGQRPISLRTMMDTGGGAPVPAPALGLRGNSNYILSSNGNPLTGVSVTINVTQDIVCQSASFGTLGFSFQLNGLSPASASTTAQQYFIGFTGSEIGCGVNNWAQPIILDGLPLTAVPGPGIPSGYQLTIVLKTGSNGNVTEADYSVLDNDGKTTPGSIPLMKYGATAAQLAPILAFELNLVGPYSKENVVLSSGSGSIVYEASSPLTVTSYWPAWLGSVGGTDENANSIYGVLRSGPSTVFSQPFTISG